MSGKPRCRALERVIDAVGEERPVGEIRERIVEGLGREADLRMPCVRSRRGRSGQCHGRAPSVEAGSC